MAETAADFFTALATQDEKLASTLVKMNFEVEKAGKAGEAAAVAQETIASSDEVIAKVETAGKFAAEQAVTKFATDVGLNPEVRNEAAATVEAATMALDDYYREYNTAISDIEKAGPPSLIRRFVNAKLQSKGISTETDAEFRAKTAEAKIKAASGYITTVNNLTQETATSQKAITPTLNAAAAEATVTKIAAVANLAVQKQAIENAKFNIAGMNEVMNIERAQLGNKATALQIQEQQADRALRREQLALATEERADRIAAKKAAKEDEQAYLQDVRVGLAALNSPQFSPNVDDATLLRMVRNKSENPILRQAASIGEARRIGDQIQVSSNAGQAAEIVVGTDARFGPEKAKLLTAIKSAYAIASTGGNLNGEQKLSYDPKDKTAVKANISNYVESVSNTYHSQIKPDDNSNPYAAPVLGDILKTPAMAKVPFIQEVIKPLAENGMTRTDPQTILDQGIESISSGRMKVKDVTFGVNAIFNQATRVNNASQEFSGFGWRTQTDYNAVVADSFGRVQTLDLTDPVAVQNYVMKQLSSRRQMTSIDPNKLAYQPNIRAK